MKLLLISDLHLDLKTFGVIDPETGINTRSLDGIKALRQVVEYATLKSNKIDYLIMSGDIFDNKSPSQNVINEFFQLIKKLSESHVKTYILTGNHDNSKVETRQTALDLANILGLPNIYVTRGDEYLDLEDLQIVSPNYWHSVEETEQILDNLTKKVDFNRPAIVVAHLEVPYPGSYGAYSDSLDILPLEVLQKHDKYLFHMLGHIHKPMILSKEPLIFYTGSLVRCSFTEEFDEKGFLVCEIKNNKLVSMDRIPIECLNMKTYKGNMSSIKQELDKVKSEDLKDTIVRCIIDVTEEPVDNSYLKSKFENTFYFSVKQESNKIKHQKIDTTNLMSLKEYGRKYFEKHPRKKELLALMQELEQIDESKQNS